jgi:hypothetical protein
MEARLAPFYRGLEDYDENYTEQSIGKLLDELKERDYEEGVANSVVEAMKAEREPTGAVGTVTKKIKIHRARDTRLEEEKAERDKRERRAYLGAIECPICFLVRRAPRRASSRSGLRSRTELSIKHQHVEMLSTTDMY